MKNPALEEATEILLYRKESFFLHAGYLLLLSLFLIVVWPSRSYMYFFRTESVPPVFLANAVFLILLTAGISCYLGLDRLATGQTIRYVEWLERTSVPVRSLVAGKIATAVIHTAFLVCTGIPMLVAAAGPSGVPLSVLPGLCPVVYVTALACRVSAMIVSHYGEESYVIRTIGIWVVAALLFVLSLRIYRPMNPIVAAVEQIAVRAPGAIGDIQSGSGNERVAGVIGLATLVVVLSVVYWVALQRHRTVARRRKT